MGDNHETLGLGAAGDVAPAAAPPELDQAAFEQALDEPLVDDGEEYADFDAWLAAQDAKAKRVTERIFGVQVTLPLRMTLQAELELDRLEGSASLDDLKKVLRLLLGDDPMDAWLANGMDDVTFQAVLAWAASNMKGRPLTMPQAYRAVQAGRTAAAQPGGGGKGGTPGPTSSGTGAPSSRTSGASTTSPRRRSGNSR